MERPCPLRSNAPDHLRGPGRRRREVHWRWRLLSRALQLSVIPSRWHLETKPHQAPSVGSFRVPLGRETHRVLRVVCSYASCRSLCAWPFSRSLRRVVICPRCRLQLCALSKPVTPITKTRGPGGPDALVVEVRASKPVPEHILFGGMHNDAVSVAKPNPFRNRSGQSTPMISGILGEEKTHCTMA